MRVVLSQNYHTSEFSIVELLDLIIINPYVNFNILKK